MFISEEEQQLEKERLDATITQWVEKIQSWEKAIHCWVIGPGLGRDPYMHVFFKEAIKHIGKGKVVIFDADGIYYLAQFPEVMEHLHNCKTIITPNHREMSFLRPYLHPMTPGEDLLDEV